MIISYIRIFASLNLFWYQFLVTEYDNYSSCCNGLEWTVVLFEQARNPISLNSHFHPYIVAHVLPANDT